MSTEYLARMENLLHLYAQPYPAYLLVCFDERSARAAPLSLPNPQ